MALPPTFKFIIYLVVYDDPDVDIVPRATGCLVGAGDGSTKFTQIKSHPLFTPTPGQPRFNATKYHERFVTESLQHMGDQPGDPHTMSWLLRTYREWPNVYTKLLNIYHQQVLGNTDLRLV